MAPDKLLEVLHDAASAVAAALADLADWGPVDARDGRYRSDLAADAAALEVLERAGLGALSEESGLHHPEREVVVALDPLDGSTNASRGVPWFATSLCAVGPDGPLAAVVLDLPRGARYEAVRGGGASCDGVPLAPSTCTEMARALVGLAGHPAREPGWSQYRALGAAALDLCAVAAGTLDAYLDFSSAAHGPWDFLGGALICQEAGALVGDAFGRPLAAMGHRDRRSPVAAATVELHAAALAARRAG